MTSDSIIASVHWDRVTLSGWRTGGQVYVLWADAVNADACFEAAGFSAWRDEDPDRWECWDNAFISMADCLIDHLTSLGDARTVCHPQPVPDEGLYEVLRRKLWGKPPRDPFAESPPLYFAISDDQYGDWEVEFGEEPRAALYASGGHELLWLWLASDEDFSGALAAWATDRPARQLVLEWQRLWPFHGPR